jgi:digeranylgeranylglycerophospholipid reductase
VEEVDVLVVGAGPAGSTVATQLARRGHRVVVAEEHPRVGFPVQCAGLVSQRVLDLAEGRSFVRTSVRGAAVFGPGLGSVSFKADTPRAFVIDRAGLDIYLADRAARAGAEIRCSTRFDGIGPSPDGFTEAHLTDPDGGHVALRARLVVGADGVSSGVARAFRLRRPIEFLPAFEAEFSTSPGDPETVEVYLGRMLSPGLFGWWIPDGEGGARVGVAVDADGTPARLYFDRLVAHLARRFGRPLPHPTAYLVSGIPIGTVPRTVGPGVLLVGDAAAQVKPLSGGGIFTGMRCGQLAAETADAALKAADRSVRALSAYERAWHAEFGDEFRKALYLRRVFQRLNDADLDRLIAALQGSELAATIVAFGDIDFPTHVARQLLRQSPSLVRLMPKALGAWVSSGGWRAPDLDFDGRK